MNTSTDEFVRGGGETPPSVGNIPNVLPEVLIPSADKNSNTGESIGCTPDKGESGSAQQHWYALRCTYGREKKAYEYFLRQGIKVFYPTITAQKSINGKNVLVEESRIPNLFFAYGNYDTIQEYVFDNVHDETKHVRFYYNKHHDGTREPLIIPDKQIRSLMLLCDTKANDILLEPFVVEKFLKGQRVKIKEGDFAGVEGVVARFQGQQRVGIVIEGLMTMITAYVPSAFLERIENNVNEPNGH